VLLQSCYDAKYAVSSGRAATTQVNNTIGPGYDDSNALTWQGRTQINLTIDFADPSSRPWQQGTFMLSTEVRSQCEPYMARHVP
jgi:hypothetical protein